MKYLTVLNHFKMELFNRPSHFVRFLKRLVYLGGVTLVGVHWMVATSLWAASEFHYTYHGNFKGLIQYPEGHPTKAPVIIYNYDQFYDWAGKDVANQQGYSLEAFCDAMSDWGYIVIVPIERFRKLNAIKGAIHYAKTLESSDPNQLFVIGKGEGSFLSILAAADLPVTSLIVVAPNSIDYTGYFSLPNLIRKIEPIRSIPVLFIAATGESKNKIKFQQAFHTLLKDQGVKMTLLQFPEKQKWFRHHDRAYMESIRHYLKTFQSEAPHAN